VNRLDQVTIAHQPSHETEKGDPAAVAAAGSLTLSEPAPGRAPGALEETIALLADGRLRLRAHTSMPMQQAAEAHRQLESGTVHERIILILDARPDRRAR
jgi:NADPH:quinone reductase-like Zn-dependent oxidoreductase